MNTQPVYTEHRSRYTAAQLEVLNGIGNALKRRQINFHIATRLRDLVLAGQVDEVEKHLKPYRQTRSF